VFRSEPRHAVGNHAAARAAIGCEVEYGCISKIKQIQGFKSVGIIGDGAGERGDSAAAGLICSCLSSSLGFKGRVLRPNCWVSWS
jgi:hypothetical protein